MSAFLVSDECIQKCVLALLEENENPDKLGDKLFALNLRALTERYGAKHGDTVDAPFKYAPGYPPNAYAKLKALECLLYQCSEGSVPETSLYRRVKDGIYYLRGEILHTIPAYNAEPWGS